MKRFLIVFALIISMALSSNAQSYKTGLGLRGSPSAGISVKHFISGESAIEGLLSTRHNGFLVTALYEVHAEAFSISGLYWYYGAGAHIGAWNKYYKTDREDNYSVIGIDGIVGIEYNIAEIPINISLDYKPALNILGKPAGLFDEVALSVRYVFGWR